MNNKMIHKHINSFFSLLLLLILSSCGNGSFTLENNKGVIDSLPGQNWNIFFLFIIVVVLVIYFLYGVTELSGLSSLIKSAESALPDSIQNLNNTIDKLNIYADENKKINNENLLKEKKIFYLEGQIKALNDQIDQNRLMYNKDLEIEKLNLRNTLEHEKIVLIQNITYLETELNRFKVKTEVYLHYLSKYKINIIYNSAYDFDTQKTVWKQMIGGGEIESVLDHMASHSSIPEEKLSIITGLQRQLTDLNKQRLKGTVEFSGGQTDITKNRITDALIEMINRL